MNKIEIKTSIMSQPNGSGKLKLTVKNGWKFWSWMYVDNTKRIKKYLKSDEFKEFAYSVFSKYDGMTYGEMCNTDRKPDFQKIWEKLDGFAWRKEYELNSLRDYHIKITKHERLDDNYGVYTSYMYITGRIYNKDCSSYRRFKTIVDFCLDDMYCTALDDAYYAKYEDYDADIYSDFDEEFDRKYKITDKKINDYVDELFYCSQGEYIESYNDCKKFYQICNASIDEYKNRFNRAA